MRALGRSAARGASRESSLGQQFLRLIDLHPGHAGLLVGPAVAVELLVLRFALNPQHLELVGLELRRPGVAEGRRHGSRAAAWRSIRLKSPQTMTAHVIATAAMTPARPRITRTLTSLVSCSTPTLWKSS